MVFPQLTFICKQIKYAFHNRETTGQSDRLRMILVLVKLCAHVPHIDTMVLRREHVHVFVIHPVRTSMYIRPMSKRETVYGVHAYAVMILRQCRSGEQPNELTRARSLMKLFPPDTTRLYIHVFLYIRTFMRT